MSQFEKIIIPLIEPKLKPIDFTDKTGFIGCYTFDPDRPSFDKEFFIVFNNNIRNEYTKDLSVRLSHSLNIKNTYIKRVNNIPYYVYSFYVKPELKKYYNGILDLTASHKIKVANFWSPSDKLVNNLLSNTILHTTVDHNMPLTDYQQSYRDKISSIIKKGDSLK